MTFFRTNRHLFLAFFLYLGVGIIATYPLIRHLNDSLYGLPGDNYATLWSFWWNKTHALQLTAPAQPTLLIGAKFLSLLINEVATYNLIAIFSYPFAGLAIYLIVHYFTQDKAASFIAGFIYVMGPYHIYQSYIHLSLAMIAWLPAYFYALLLWLKQPKTWRAAVSGCLLALVVLDNYYYGYLAVLLTVFFVVGLFIQSLRGRVPLWVALYQGVVAAGLAGIIAGPFIWPSLYSGAAASLERPLRELYVFRAQWWDFFVPPITHPVIGRLVQMTTSYELAGSNYFERTLYLGYMPLIMAIVGVWRTRKSWLTYLLVSLFAASILIATAPGFIAPLLHNWFPTFRVYSRFGLLCLMATSILAGIGISSLSKGVRSWMLYLALVLFVAADFYPLMPSPMIDINTVKPYETVLAQQPKGETIVYPLANSDEVRTTEYLSDSRRFGQPMWNAINPMFHQDNVRDEMLDPRAPRVLNMMREMKINYVVVHKDIYAEGRLPESIKNFYDPDYPVYLQPWSEGVAPDLTNNPAYTVLYTDNTVDLLRLNPAPVETTAPSIVPSPTPSPSQNATTSPIPAPSASGIPTH